jgi:hypothetical protein
MKNFVEGLLVAIGVMVVVAIVAVLGGTIVFWIWPVAIPAAFPGLVESGVLAAKIAWWPAVCLTWLFGILIKSTQTNNNKS